MKTRLVWLLSPKKQNEHQSKSLKVSFTVVEQVLYVMKSRVNFLMEVLDSLDGFITSLTNHRTVEENIFDAVKSLLDLGWL